MGEKRYQIENTEYTTRLTERELHNIWDNVETSEEKPDNIDDLITLLWEFGELPINYSETNIIKK